MLFLFLKIYFENKHLQDCVYTLVGAGCTEDYVAIVLCPHCGANCFEFALIQIDNYFYCEISLGLP